VNESEDITGGTSQERKKPNSQNEKSYLSKLEKGNIPGGSKKKKKDLVNNPAKEGHIRDYGNKLLGGGAAGGHRHPGGA